MAENPLAKLARLVGGAAMLPGPLGHQVLGQMLIARSRGTELAGANVVLAAVSRQTNAAVQIAVRSMVPAVLVEALSRIKRQQLKSLSSELKRLLENLEQKSEEIHGKPGWETLEAQQKHEASQSLNEALSIELLKLWCQGGQPERKVKALKYLLGKHAPKQMGDGDGHQCTTDEDRPKRNPETPAGILPCDIGRNSGE